MPRGLKRTSVSIPWYMSILPAHTPTSRLLHALGPRGLRQDLLLQLLLVRRKPAFSGFKLTLTGPFELTKVSAQVSVLMSDRNKSSMSDATNSSSSSGRAARAVASSYQNKGTFQTAKNIVKHRGFAGLYSGFNLHLRK